VRTYAILRFNFFPHQSFNHSIRNPCLHMLGIVTVREIIGELIDKRLLRMGEIDEWIMQQVDQLPLMVCEQGMPIRLLAIIGV